MNGKLLTSAAFAALFACTALAIPVLAEDVATQETSESSDPSTGGDAAAPSDTGNGETPSEGNDGATDNVGSGGDESTVAVNAGGGGIEGGVVADDGTDMSAGGDPTFDFGGEVVDLPSMNAGGEGVVVDPPTDDVPVEPTGDNPEIYQSGAPTGDAAGQPELPDQFTPPSARSDNGSSGGSGDMLFKKRKRGARPSLFGSNSPLKDWIQRSN